MVFHYSHKLLYSSLFLKKGLDGSGKMMLPLKNQQMAFENIYLKAQEGMRRQVKILYLHLNVLRVSKECDGRCAILIVDSHDSSINNENPVIIYSPPKYQTCIIIIFNTREDILKNE